MTHRRLAHTTLTCGLTLAVFAAAIAGAALQTSIPLTIGSGRLSIAGTSNVHDYTATTTAVRITRAQLAPQVTGAALWDEAVKPGAIGTFEIAVAAGTLKSGKDGLDKNMYKALKITEHPDISFRLVKLQAGATQDALKAVGMLTIAGVEREVVLDLKTQLKDATLIVKGELPMVMTEYGIKPPKAMLGMITTNPKVIVTFEIVLAVADAAAAR